MLADIAERLTFNGVLIALAQGAGRYWIVSDCTKIGSCLTYQMNKLSAVKSVVDIKIKA